MKLGGLLAAGQVLRLAKYGNSSDKRVAGSRARSTGNRTGTSAWGLHGISWIFMEFYRNFMAFHVELMGMSRDLVEFHRDHGDHTFEFDHSSASSRPACYHDI